MLETVVIDKLVHGGQGIGVLKDGRKILVWNALPGEKVKVRITKNKNKYAEGIAEEIIDISPDRVIPKDPAYLSTSPWQIMKFQAENRLKQEILTETYTREKVNYKTNIELVSGSQEWQYRTKMEFSFWADDDGLHLAFYGRGTHNKQIVTGSSIARPEIDMAANNICAILNNSNVRGSQLKTVVVRCNQAGDCVVGLFVKDENFKYIPELDSVASGLAVYHSDPKSPASVRTKELYSFGSLVLSDKVLDLNLSYDVNSFFQVNLPVFETVLSKMKSEIVDTDYVIDFYSGVGTIGFAVGATAVVESDKSNTDMAKLNKKMLKTKIIHSTSEKSLDLIPDHGVLIVDPPRAGLHPKFTDEILHVGPDKILYLSCNPITHARDLSILQTKYHMDSIVGYNFFPKTPHIEVLSVLSKI